MQTCHKQYEKAAELEVHLSSYDHHHKKVSKSVLPVVGHEIRFGVLCLGRLGLEFARSSFHDVLYDDSAGPAYLFALGVLNMLDLRHFAVAQRTFVSTMKVTREHIPTFNVCIYLQPYFKKVWR